MLIVPITFAVLSAAQETTDWPQFQGPDRNASIAAVESDFAWGDDGPEIVWRAPTGPGFAGAAIRDGKVFLHDREAGTRDVLRVRDLATGEELWQLGYDAPGRLPFPGSRNVPLVTQKRVITAGGQGRVIGIDRESHEIAWELDFEETYGGEMPHWGWSASPLLVDDLVVLTVLGSEIGLVAVDVETGEERWTTGAVGESHSTPTVLELQGRRQIVFLSTREPPSSWDAPSPTLVSSFDPEDGSVLWQTETLLTCLPIPAPVQVGENRIFVTGGYRSGSKLLELTHTDGEFRLEEVFAIARGSQIHAPVLHDDHLYLIVTRTGTTHA